MMFEKIKKTVIHNGKWIICFICLILFLALAEDVFHHEIMKGDVIGYQLVSMYLIHHSLTPIMKIITWFGSAPCLILITLFCFLWIKNKKIGCLIGTNLVLVTILNQILKFILQRPRPTEFRIINEVGYSFPSGHSMISMAFYGLFIYFIWKKVKTKSLKVLLTILLSLFILAIGISRIYLGVHYTSDVIAGFLVATSYLILYINFTNKFILNHH